MSAFDSDEEEEEPLLPLRSEDAEGTRDITEYMRRSRISTQRSVKDFERTLRREKRDKAKLRKKRAKKPRFDYLYADVAEWNKTYRPTLNKKEWDDCYVCKDIKDGYAMIARDKKTGAIASVMQWDSSEYDVAGETTTVAFIDATGTRNDYRGRGLSRYMVQELVDNYDLVIVPMSAHDQFWRNAGFTNINDLEDDDYSEEIWDLVRTGPFDYAARWHIFLKRRK